MPGKELVLHKQTSMFLGRTWIDFYTENNVWMNNCLPLPAGYSREQELLVAQVSGEQPQGELSGLRAEVTFSE